uniref:Ig-like domain-containing protein n=1 Tax=Amphilophus citrinellus TaxID=61819 RepID=A0A3Q0SRT6_AMPCI
MKHEAVSFTLKISTLTFNLSALSFPLSEQKIVKAESGENVTLTCRTPTNIIVLEWDRADLRKDEYVLLYRDGHFEPANQHPSFKNRVDLQDKQMKDGDVSLILRNVTVNDTGTYECRVIQRRTNRWKRALLETPPISIITLRTTLFIPDAASGDPQTYLC